MTELTAVQRNWTLGLWYTAKLMSEDAYADSLVPNLGEFTEDEAMTVFENQPPKTIQDFKQIVLEIRHNKPLMAP